jgi:hypothetical protein
MRGAARNIGAGDVDHHAARILSALHAARHGAAAPPSPPTMEREVRAAVAAVTHAFRAVRRRISEFLDPLNLSEDSSSSSATTTSDGSGRHESPVDEEDTAAGAVLGSDRGGGAGGASRGSEGGRGRRDRGRQCDGYDGGGARISPESHPPAAASTHEPDRRPAELTSEPPGRDNDASGGCDDGRGDGGAAVNEVGDGAGSDEGRAARMDAFFADARRRLAAARRLFTAGDDAGLRTEARALARMAAAAGARSVQDAADALWDGRGRSRSAAGGSGGGGGWAATAEEEGPVRRAAVDGLELQMDAAEAIWRSCRMVV